MDKTKYNLVERRRYVRLDAPIDVSYTVPETGNVLNTNIKNISADGLRFETPNKSIKESDIVELTGFQSGLGQTVVHRMLRKTVVMFSTCEAFFLRSGDQLSIDHQSSCRIMIKRGDTEDCCQGTALEK